MKITSGVLKLQSIDAFHSHRVVLHLMTCSPYDISLSFHNFMLKRSYTFPLYFYVPCVLWFFFFVAVVVLIAMLNGILF